MIARQRAINVVLRNEELDREEAWAATVSRAPVAPTPAAQRATPAAPSHRDAATSSAPTAGTPAAPHATQTTGHAPTPLPPRETQVSSSQRGPRSVRFDISPPPAPVPTVLAAAPSPAPVATAPTSEAALAATAAAQAPTPPNAAAEAAPSDQNTQPCASHTPSATTTQPNAPHAQSAESRTHAQHQPQRGLSARGHPNLRWVAPHTQRRSPSASQTQSAPNASPTQSATTTEPNAPPAQSAETQPWANPEQFRGAHSAELAVIPVHQQQITEQSGEAQNRLIRRQHRHKCGDCSGRVRQTWPGPSDANGVRRRRWCCLHLHDAATGDALRKAQTSS